MNRMSARSAAAWASLAWALATPAWGQQHTLPPIQQAGQPLTEVASFGDDFRLVGIGVTPDGRIFATAPANDRRSIDSVVEVDPKTGRLTPYPDTAWNRFAESRPATSEWINAQALWVDVQGHLWVLDISLPSLDQSRFPPKLVEIDPATNTVLRQYPLGDIVHRPDALNDLRVDPRVSAAYLTNAGNQGSLVVLDLATGKGRQVLVGDRSTRSDPTQHFTIDGQQALKNNGQPVVLHADGIALSPKGDWLYYRPLSDHHYWRVPTAALRDNTLSPAALAGKVQFLGDSVMSGGLIMTSDGTLVGGDLQHRTVVAIKVDGQPPHLTTSLLASDPRLSWADGFGISQGKLYIADSRLWEVSFKNGYKRAGRFAIYSLQLPARATH
ncbi:L-dopachrome tautomerase-related protein [Frateuria aurantia]